ncbi:MAG: ubiquitin-activating E1 FCCH domain-containing protein [Smithella sp.]
MTDYQTFEELYAAVSSATGTGDLSNLPQVKAAINMVYLNEIPAIDEFYPLYWLVDLLDDVRTKNAATITGITAASPGVITATAHGFVSGDIVQLANIAGMTELNNRTFIVVKLTADTFSLTDLTGMAVNTTALTAYSAGGNVYHRGVTLTKQFRKIISFSFHGYSAPLEPIDFDELEESTQWNDPATHSRPTRYLHKSGYSTAGAQAQRLLWYTLPNAVYAARVWGEVRPSRLTATTDVPVGPPEIGDAIVAGAISRLVQYGNVQIENAVVWPSVYKAHLEALKNENRAWWKQFKKDERSGLYLA